MSNYLFRKRKYLREKLEFPVLCAKTDGGYKEKDVVRNAWEDLGFVENGKFCLIFNVST